jgi:hypothetical protein
LGRANLIGVCSTGGKVKKAFAGQRVLDFTARIEHCKVQMKKP